MNLVSDTNVGHTVWYDSHPHLSQVYVATWTTGFTSVHRVTIPRAHTNLPILDALILRIDKGFWEERCLKWISLYQ